MREPLIRIPKIAVPLIWAAMAVFAGRATAAEVVERPDFASRWFLTVILSNTNSPLDLELERQLSEDPALAAIVAQTNYHVWKDGQTKWLDKTAWRALLEKMPRPIIILQAPSNADGTSRAVFVRAGSNLPLDGTLASQMFEASAAHSQAQTPEVPEQCPLKPKPPQPVTPERPPVVPLVETPSATPAEDDTSIPLIFFLLPAAGCLAGMYRSKNE